jgi:hypothetical protein
MGEHIPAMYEVGGWVQFTQPRLSSTLLSHTVISSSLRSVCHGQLTSVFNDATDHSTLAPASIPMSHH